MSAKRDAKGKANTSLALQELGSKLLSNSFSKQIKKAVKAATWDFEGEVRFALGFLFGALVFGLPAALLALYVTLLTIPILGLIAGGFGVMWGISFATIPRLKSLFDVHVSPAQRKIDRAKRYMDQVVAEGVSRTKQLTEAGMLTEKFAAMLQDEIYKAQTHYHEVLLEVATENPSVHDVLKQEGIEHRALPPGANPPDQDASDEQ